MKFIKVDAMESMANSGEHERLRECTEISTPMQTASEHTWQEGEKKTQPTKSIYTKMYVYEIKLLCKFH